MKTDYKFWYIKREDDVHISEVAVRFYEGEVINGKYVRSKRLSKKDVTHFKGKEIKKERNSNEAIIFTTDDFGVISTDEELRKFLNKELAKDKSREPIDQQK